MYAVLYVFYVALQLQYKKVGTYVSTSYSYVGTIGQKNVKSSVAKGNCFQT